MLGGKVKTANCKLQIANWAGRCLSMCNVQCAMCKLQCFALLALVLGPGQGRADLDPELASPYRLRVVLHVADNRFLTPLFQTQLERSLRDGLRLSLGALAEVEVVRSHPLIREVEAKGLEAGLAALDQIGPVKLHFVVIDFAGGVYTVQARQYDGNTGLLSPVVRRATTSDRGQVSSLAAQLVEHDFGLSGTVIEVGKEVKVALRAGKTGGNLDRWLRPGEVFAISRITSEGERLRGTRVRWALLETLAPPKDGVVRCRLWQRFQEDDLRPAPGVVGYRCLKLTTLQGPVKLRLVDPQHLRPLDGVAVRLETASGGPADELATNREGLIVSRASFKHLAIVKVLSGGAVRALVPLELVDDRTVTCPVKLDADAETHAALDFRKAHWFARILTNLGLAAERVQRLNQQLTQSLETALATARSGISNMDAEIEYLAAERAELLRQAAQRSAPKPDLREGDQAFAALKEKRAELAQFIVRVEGVLKESGDAKALGVHKLLERARLLEGEAEYDQAIALYEKVLRASPEQAKVGEHLEKLKATWKPRTAAHAEARKFLVEIWPTLEVAELDKNLPRALAALKVCRAVADRLTPRRVVQANVVHANNLKKALDALKRLDTEDSRTRAKAIAVLAEGLRQLHAEAVLSAGVSKE